MKIFSSENVYDAAIRRINRLFDEFEQVVVTFSGGKDSVVVLNLALKIAEERGLLPLPVLFLDQEAEWSYTIDFIRQVMYDPRVKPYWMQIPMRIFNATSNDEHWLHCWDKENQDKWIHPQDPISYKENVYGTDRFAELFNAIIKKEFHGISVASLGGVRCQESPARTLGLTSLPTYKDITWGKQIFKGSSQNPKHQFTFYPIYDWEISDVWKAIYDNGWSYCKLYDYLYQYGVPLTKMRLSNVHHETAVQSLFILQEIDPVVWGKLTARIAGINTAGQMKTESIKPPDELPSMFESWQEYRDYLCENLITDEKARASFKQVFNYFDKMFIHNKIKHNWTRACIVALLANDSGTKLLNFTVKPDVRQYTKFIKGTHKPHRADRNNIYIQDALCSQS